MDNIDLNSLKANLNECLLYVRDKKVGNERIVANAWQQYMEEDNLLNERSCNLVLKLLIDVPPRQNKNGGGNNQSGSGIVGVLSKGLKFISGK